MTDTKNYTLSIGATVRATGLPKIGDTMEVKEIKLFEPTSFVKAAVLDVKKEDVNNSGNIRYTVVTDLGTAEIWEYEIK